MLTPSPLKFGEGNGKTNKGGWGGRWSLIVPRQRKVRNLGNLESITEYIHRAALFKSGRVQNLGGVTY